MAGGAVAVALLNRGEAAANISFSLSEVGFGAAFLEVMGKKWSAFVCDFEDYYKVNGSDKCVPKDSWNAAYSDPGGKKTPASDAPPGDSTPALSVASTRRAIWLALLAACVAATGTL